MSVDNALEIKLASLSEILKNIEEKVVTLERNDKEIIQALNDLKGSKIAGLQTEIALLQERVALLQRISYSVIGVILLAVIGAVTKLVLNG